MPVSGLLDEKGLIREGAPLLIYVVAEESVIPLMVKFRYNLGYEEFKYGPLPISESGYESGVIPAGKTTESLTFPYSPLPAEVADDMFYFVESDRVIHANIKVYPSLLRVIVEVPKGQKAYSLYGKVTQDVTRDFGWFRFKKEMVFLPKIHIGWVFRNPTNLDLRTYVEFTYGEYNVEPIIKEDVLLDILTGKKPYYEVPYGGPMKFRELYDALDILNAPLIKKPKLTDTRETILSYIKEGLERVRR